MEASTGPPRLPTPPIDFTTDKIKQKLLKDGVNPTPKIIHTLRKKHLHKSLRKSKRNLACQPLPLPESQRQSIADEAHFQALKSEYNSFMTSIAAKPKDDDGVVMVGKPWEGLERVRLRDMATSSKEYGGDKLKREHLRELGEFLERDAEKFRWLLDDDIELQEGGMEEEKQSWGPPKRRGGEAEAIRFLVDKLSSTELNVKDWKFSRMMKLSMLQFTEGQLLKIVEGLGDKGQWRLALSVVEWVYSSKEHRHYKRRFVYTKLLAVLGKAQRPHEALRIFDLMREDGQIYPDMPAYRCIAVSLGQAGHLKELINIIESMREKPAKRIKNVRYKNWDPALQPDIVVCNAVLNACVPSRQWRGVSWVFQLLRKNSLKPNGATYGLAMEVMLRSGKYELVHEYFGKMKRSGEAPNGLTYKVLVRAFWEEGKVDEAVEAVRDMERRGVVGSACVYYELACCLCNNGRWEEAMMEVEKLKKLPHTKPLAVTFTGMIMSSLDGGHVRDCISIFQQSKNHCGGDIGMINAMLKVYERNDMFSKAKELFEQTKGATASSNNSLNGFGSSLSPDSYTYTLMLQASASAHQWEYFEFVYRELALSGYLIEQSKHASLLVEASKAGKWHLLEHAFDTILEAGEIPHVPLFTELICQAIIQHDYERVVSLVNSLAHSPSQMSAKHWADLFERNADRFNMENLKELLETLNNHELSMEATISNLLKSLVSYCRYNDESEILNPVSFDDASFGNSGRLNCLETVIVNNFSVNSLGTKPCDNGKKHGYRDGYSNSDREEDADSTMSRNLNYDCNREDKGAKLCTGLEDLEVDEMFDESDDELSESFECINSDIEERELDVPTKKFGDSRGTDLPSADEILESWKESRKKGGTFFPSQFSWQVKG